MTRDTSHGRLVRDAIFVACGFVLAFLFALEIKSPSLAPAGKPPLREFGAFYAAGYVLNHYPSPQLYDRAFYQQVHRRLFPNAPPNHEAPYAHAPFEAMVFRPLALLPYLWALRLWQAACLALYSAGFLLLWLSSKHLPRKEWPTALVVFLSFNSICMEAVVRGQASSLGFIFICIALHAARRGADFVGGLALSVCVTKPTLLLLVLPMLVATRGLRMLSGFAAGAAALGVVSVFVVGWAGFVAYLNVVRYLGSYATGASGFASPFNVDLHAFFRMLTGGNRALVAALLLLSGVPVAVLLLRTWLASGHEAMRRDKVWPLTLTWTMLLSPYAATYDTPTAIVGLVVTADVVCGRFSGRIPRTFAALVVVAYLASWCPALPLAGDARLQVFTLGLLAVGTYQLRLASPGSSGSLLTRRQCRSVLAARRRT